MCERRGLLVVFSAPSDCGKDTILHRKVVAVYKDMPANNTFGNPLILIKMPCWEYKAVKVDQDSIQALWDGPGKCQAMVWNIEGSEDSLFANAELYGESSESDPISLSASSYQATGEPEYKDVTLRASCDSTKPAPVMAKRVWKDYRWGSIYCKLKPGTNPDTLAAMLKAYHPWKVYYINGEFRGYGIEGVRIPYRIRK